VTAQDVSCEALTRGNVFKICCPFGDEDSPATFTKLVKEFTADKRDNEDMFEVRDSSLPHVIQTLTVLRSQWQ